MHWTTFEEGPPAWGGLQPSKALGVYSKMTEDVAQASILVSPWNVNEHMVKQKNHCEDYRIKSVTWCININPIQKDLTT